MNLYEKKFTCSLTSDKGAVRVENVAGKIMPSDAELSGNVVIDLKPLDETNGHNCRIYLDDLDYDSERSEFVTDGPVRIVSRDAKLSGRGLNLIYNSELSRIEQIKIIDLDFLTINRASKEKKSPVVISESVSRSSSPESCVREVEADKTESDQKMASQNATSVNSKSDKAVQNYLCFFRDNVVITSGENKIAADELKIANIIWGKQQEDESEPRLSSELQDPAVQKQSISDSAVSENRKEVGAEADGDEEAEDNDQKIRVTCDGGMLLRPADTILNNERDEDQIKDRSLEFIGSPVRFTQSDKELARCGLLKYNVDGGFVDLFATDECKYVEMQSSDEAGRLKTSESIKWDRNENVAKVAGPGNVFFKDKDKQTFDMKFNGLMDIAFNSTNEVSGEEGEGLEFKSVDITGGMNALVSAEKTSKLSSNDAYLEFGTANQIRNVNLKGAVDFQDDNGALSADSANVFFVLNEEGKSVPANVKAVGNAKLKPSKTDSAKYPSVFRAHSIEYDLLESYAKANGPVRVDFYYWPSDSDQAEPSPVVLTAEGCAEYFAQTHRIVIHDDVLCKTTQDRIAFTQLNTLSGDKLTIDLLDSADTNNSEDATAKIKNINLVGEKVKLVSERKTTNLVLNKIVLTSNEVNFDAVSQVVTSGPGKIEIDNRNAPRAAGERAVSFRGPCFGLIENFSKLDWNIAKQEILAKGSDELIHVGYVPVLDDGSLGQEKLIDAGRIFAKFENVGDGKVELKKVYACESVLYEEPGEHQFVGESLDFNAERSLVVVRGSKANPCMLDNNLVDNIVYNLATGDFEASIEGRGSVRIPAR